MSATVGTVIQRCLISAQRSSAGTIASSSPPETDAMSRFAELEAKIAEFMVANPSIGSLSLMTWAHEHPEVLT
jgi:hypothetical protein